MMFRALVILLLSCIVGLSAPPPLLRNAWSTNTAGTPVRGVNDLSVTNAAVAGTNWEFFGISPRTVARLMDISNLVYTVSGLRINTNGVFVGMETNLNFVSGNALTIQATNFSGSNSVQFSVDQMAPIMGSLTNLPLSINGITHIIDEEFLGKGTTSAQMGRENWIVTAAGGGAVNTGVVGGDWEPGVISELVTNAADRALLNNNDNFNNFNGVTNMEVYCLSRVRVGLTNTATDQDGFFIGLCGGASTAEPTDGVYWRLTNNIWEVCTARSSARTSLVTLSNCVPMTWYNLSWHLDSTGTNVNFYMGMSLSNMVFQTNISATIPNTINSLTPSIMSRKIVGATTRMTNWVDNYHIWVRRLR